MKLIAVLAGAIALAVPAVASADVRTLAHDDPQDSQATVSGKRSGPDIQHVDVAYDSAGSLRIVMRFWGPVDDNDYSSGRYRWIEDFSLGKYNANASMSYRSCDALASGYFNVYHNRGRGVIEQLSVNGLAGNIPLTVTTSEDKTAITAEASSPGLANLDAQCFSTSMPYRQTASASHPDSRYDEGADVWYLYGTQDMLEGTAYFGGFDPGPIEQCRDGIDNDGNGDVDYPMDDTGCSSPTDTFEQSPQCSDGKDNDGDGVIDYEIVGGGDPNCSNEADDSEAAAPKVAGSPSPKKARLSKSAAKSQAYRTIKRRFGNAYRKRSDSSLRCSRSGRLKFACRYGFTFKRVRRTGGVLVTRKTNGTYVTKLGRIRRSSTTA